MRDGILEPRDIRPGWHIRIHGQFADGKTTLTGQVTQLMPAYDGQPIEEQKCFRLGCGDTSRVVSYERIDRLEVLDTGEEITAERVDV